MAATSAVADEAVSREEIAQPGSFAKLGEPRQSGKVMYPLPEIVLLVVVEICAWGEHHLDFLRRYLPFANGIPSHDACRFR